jgi:SAM-dependent methyltransferase
MTDPLPKDWTAFWNDRADLENDFSATGRGGTDEAEFLYTVREVIQTLDLQRDDVVLDIGCGAGLISLAMSPLVAAIKGIDLSPKLVERARNKLQGVSNVTFDAGSITETGEVESSYTKVLAYSVLQYLDGEDAARQACAEVARILAPGGRGLLAANPDPVRRTLCEKRVIENTPENKQKESLTLLDHVLWLSPERLEELARESGLEAKAIAISPRIRQHFYMYDLVVTKHG